MNRVIASDSLTKAGEQQKIEFLLQEAAKYNKYNPEKTIELAEEALKIAVSREDVLQQANASYEMALGYITSGENINALNYFIKALKAYKIVEDKLGVAKSSNSCGRVYRFLGDYSTSLEYHLRALKSFEMLNDNKGIAASTIDAGIAYRNLGNEDLAIEYYDRALDLSQQTNDLISQVNALVAKGNIFWYQSDFDQSLRFYEKALEISSLPDFTGDNLSGIYNNIGNVHRQKHNYNMALDFYSKSMAISQETGDKNMICTTLKNIGIAHKMQGKYDLAIKVFKESMELAQRIRYRMVHKETLNQLSETYALLNDYKMALDYHKAFNEMNESMKSEEVSNRISIMQLGQHLKDEAQKQTIHEVDLNLKMQKERNIRNIIIFITLLAVSLIFVLWSRYKIKTKANQELINLNTDLEQRVEERTRRLREENERRKIAQENAELANDTKNRFLANISHEVRTPINAIIGFCDLTMKLGITEEQAVNMTRIKDSSEHLLSLIKDIIEYSQMETGQTSLKAFSFHLREVMESVMNAFYLDSRSKKIVISLKYDNRIPEAIIGDKDTLRQILYNLIGNALKFTEKGKIEVAVSLDGEIENSGRLKLRFSVKDTGIGISKMKQKLIFMDFAQEYDTSSRKYGGAGLGLTISKHFVELMDGEIWVESEKGKGSEFIFSIFLDIDHNKLNDPEKVKTQENRKFHILIAEDNLLNAQVIVAFLNRIGHTSKVAANGIEAVEYLSREDFDLVLMDIEMPEMDGLDATREIRKGNYRVRRPDIPIVALTAHALKDYEDKSYEAGMNGYLTKPVDISQLTSVLQLVVVETQAIG